MTEENLEKIIKRRKEELLRSESDNQIMSFKRMDETVSYLRKEDSDSDITKASSGLYFFFMGQKEKAREIWSDINDLTYLYKDNLFMSHSNTSFDDKLGGGIFLWNEDMGLKYLKESQIRLHWNTRVNSKTIIANDDNYVYDVSTYKPIADNLGITSPLISQNDSLIVQKDDGDIIEAFDLFSKKKILSAKKPDSLATNYNSIFFHNNVLHVWNSYGIHSYDGQKLKEVISQKSGYIGNVISIRNKIYRVECIKEDDKDKPGIYHIYDERDNLIAQRDHHNTQLYSFQNRLFDNGGDRNLMIAKDMYNDTSYGLIDTFKNEHLPIGMINHFCATDKHIFTDQNWGIIAYDPMAKKSHVIAKSIFDLKEHFNSSSGFEMTSFKISQLI